jgi:hypothetical protein
MWYTYAEKAKVIGVETQMRVKNSDLQLLEWLCDNNGIKLTLPYGRGHAYTNVELRTGSMENWKTFLSESDKIHFVPVW